MPHIAIIGAGFSGTMACVHLLQAFQNRPLCLTLIEKPGIGLHQGVAYRTQCPQHLLNVPAANMSAFPNQPNHFLDWLQTQSLPYTGPDFVPRLVYHCYLKDIFKIANATNTVDIISAEATNLLCHTDGYTVELDNRQTVNANDVILAFGNFPPAVPAVLKNVSLPPALFLADPWQSPESSSRIPVDATIMILGTGLTMVDKVLQLLAGGHTGPIIALSRHGLLPQSHTNEAVTPQKLDLPKLPTLKDIQTAFHKSIQSGTSWRALIAGLRADTPTLWQGFSNQDKQRFIKRLQPYWDVHRHLIAPQVAQMLQNAIQCGQLQILAGHLHSLHPNPQAPQTRLDVTATLKKGRIPFAVSVDQFINCTGPSNNLETLPSHLIHNLFKQGLVRPDPLNLGIDTDDNYRVLNTQGKPNSHLYVIGPLLKGRLWETIAVPELRVQAQAVAQIIVNQYKETINAS